MTTTSIAAALRDASLPTPVLEVVRVLLANGHQAFLVGGCVRDLLRGAVPKDFDVATSARPEEVQRVFRRVIPTGIEHGTVTVIAQQEHVEVTTFRSEADYVDGRRPSKVEFHTDIEADLSRRDFTINAMAFDPVNQRLVDPFGGQADLEARTIRCVRSALERFTEDGLRAMRAVRFATVLGFQVDVETEAAIAPTLHVFRKVAIERVNAEFSKLLLSPRAPEGLRLAARTGLLGAFLPEALGAEPSQVALAPADLSCRLAVLLAGSSTAKDVVARLKYPAKLASDTAHLVEHRVLPVEDAPDATLRRYLAAVTPAFLERAIGVAAALGLPVGVAPRLLAIAATHPPLSAKALALDGGQIMKALGVGPSPLVGQASRFLLDAVLDDPSRNTPDALRALLSQWPRPA